MAKQQKAFEERRQRYILCVEAASHREIVVCERRLSPTPPQRTHARTQSVAAARFVSARESQLRRRRFAEFRRVLIRAAVSLADNDDEAHNRRHAAVTW